MCGRYSLTLPPEAVRRLFAYADQPNFPPRYNIAPTQPILTVRAERGARKAALARWGLIPGWVKDPNQFRLLINARAEGIADKPSFRAAMRHRRCLVPADGFYEWKKMPRGPKQPFYIRPRSGGLLAFAGLWETWMDREGGEIDTAAIVTTGANAVLRPIHERMPVILPPDAWDEWLDECVPAKTAAALLKPVADDLLEAVPISTAVNSVANDGPLLHEPAAADAGSSTKDEPAPPGNSGLLL
ncbi:MAG: SOS response-associated peptidase [Pseudomonadota bacterium]|nr:SOS response-associated peptidase [Pseudomonadota bacterium]